MKSQILTVLLVALTSFQAFATGETMCSANTKASKVEIYLLNSRMPAAPVLSGGASIETVINGAPMTIEYDAKAFEMPGYWSVDNELKMFFYKEDYLATTLEAYTLKIEMRYDEEAMDFIGDFKMIHNGTVVDQGPVFCEFG